MAQDVLPAVEHPSTLLRVQLVDEIGAEVLVGVLVPETGRLKGQFLTEPAGDWITICHAYSAADMTHTAVAMATDGVELGSAAVYESVVMKLCRVQTITVISTDPGSAGSSSNSVTCQE